MYESEIQRLNEIIRTYTLFFIIFDIVFFATVVAVLIILIGLFKSKQKLKTSENYIRYAIRGQEEERARIARELHDTVAQDLRYCKSLGEKLEESSIKTEFCRILGKSISEVRSISYNLAPPDVTKYDLAANLMNLCQSFKEYSGIDFRFVSPKKIDTRFLTKEENLNLYRIVQESLNNILKHARADEVTVLVRNEIGTEPKGIYIFITDDGIGFDTKRNYASGTNHFGLVGMKQRAEFIKAELEISSEIGAGSQIRLVKLNKAPSVSEGTIRFK